MWSIRCRSSKGNQLIKGLNEKSTLLDLKLKIHEQVHLEPERQKLLYGFPPKIIEGQDNNSLISLSIKNGETIIVEELPGQKIITSVPEPQNGSSIPTEPPKEVNSDEELKKAVEMSIQPQPETESMIMTPTTNKLAMQDIKVT